MYCVTVRLRYLVLVPSAFLRAAASSFPYLYRLYVVVAAIASPVDGLKLLLKQMSSMMSSMWQLALTERCWSLDTFFPCLWIDNTLKNVNNIQTWTTQSISYYCTKHRGPVWIMSCGFSSCHFGIFFRSSVI